MRHRLACVLARCLAVVRCRDEALRWSLLLDLENEVRELRGWMKDGRA